MLPESGVRRNGAPKSELRDGSHRHPPPLLKESPAAYRESRREGFGSSLSPPRHNHGEARAMRTRHSHPSLRIPILALALALSDTSQSRGCSRGGGGGKLAGTRQELSVDEWIPEPPAAPVPVDVGPAWGSDSTPDAAGRTAFPGCRSTDCAVVLAWPVPARDTTTPDSRGPPGASRAHRRGTVRSAAARR